MSNSFNAFIEPRRRGHILQILASAGNAQGCNVLLLRTVLRDSGYRAPLDTLRIDLSFLTDNGFAKVREVGDLELASITSRGEDVVTGDLVVPGIEILREDR